MHAESFTACCVDMRSNCELILCEQKDSVHVNINTCASRALCKKSLRLGVGFRFRLAKIGSLCPAPTETAQMCLPWPSIMACMRATHLLHIHSWRAQTLARSHARCSSSDTNIVQCWQKLASGWPTSSARAPDMKCEHASHSCSPSGTRSLAPRICRPNLVSDLRTLRYFCYGCKMRHQRSLRRVWFGA